MGIVDEDIARVRDATNLDDLIGSHLQLRRVGRRSVGLCPFHNEKTPSFSVNAESGFYKCFGCGKSGDAITFVREILHLDFVAAVEYLAGRCGITLRYTNEYEGASRSRRKDLTDAVEAARDWYHKRLLSSEDASQARAYLRRRGFDGQTVRDYNIGWAPDDWDQLYKNLGVDQKTFLEAGLGFVNRANRVQDHFRARILFPIEDVNGASVGFGARILPDAEGPKYKNSFDSKIYAKSRLLYGLYNAKEHIVQLDESIVCEGYTDVIGFDRIGIKHAVATCGTSLTEDHIKMLKRFGRRIVLAFDADAAGQAAAARIYEWERSLEVDVAVAKLPDGVDPADLAAQDPEALRTAIDEAMPFLGFRLEQVLVHGDMSTPESNARMVQQAVAVVAQHPNELVRDQYLMQIASRANVSEQRLRSVLASELSNPTRSGRGRCNRADSQNRSDRNTWQHEAGYVQGRHAEGGVVAPAQQGPIEVIESVETRLLVLLINHPETIPGYLSAELFVDPTLREIFEAIVAHGTNDVHAAISDISPRSAEVLSQLCVMELPEAQTSQVVAHFLHNAGLSELANLQTQARNSGDPALMGRLTQLRLVVEEIRSTNFDLSVAEALLPLLIPEANS